MKLLYRLVANTFGCVFVLDQCSAVIGIHISNKRNIVDAEKFIRSLVEKYSQIQFISMEGTCGIMKHQCSWMKI
jgi:transposase-like protein